MVVVEDGLVDSFVHEWVYTRVGCTVDESSCAYHNRCVY